MPYRDPEQQKALNRKYGREWYLRNKEKQHEANKQRAKKMRLWLKTLKAGLSCAVCGESTPCCLDFHHRNPEEKDYNIGAMVVGGWKKERILAEIEKCTVLCANCHRKVHDAG